MDKILLTIQKKQCSWHVWLYVLGLGCIVLMASEASFAQSGSKAISVTPENSGLQPTIETPKNKGTEIILAPANPLNKNDVPAAITPSTKVVSEGLEAATAIQAPSAVPTKELNIPKNKKIPSLFFTYFQHQSILGAMNARGTDIAKVPEEFLPDDTNNDEKKEKPSNREVSLSGIVFVHQKEWTVWLNGMRITPDAVPVQIIDIKVFKDYIDLKWYDEYTNKIFPIRMRAHQRFNLDTRVFLPG